MLLMVLGLALALPARAQDLPTDQPPAASPRPKRLKGVVAQVTIPEKTIKEKWDELYRAIEEGHHKDYSVFPVMIYTIEGRQKLPSRIFICRDHIYMKVVEGVLQAVLPDGWRESGEYWVTSKQEALKEFARVLKAGDKNAVKSLEKMMDADLAGGVILLYKYHRLEPPAGSAGSEDEDDEPGPQGGADDEEEEANPVIMPPQWSPQPSTAAPAGKP